MKYDVYGLALSASTNARTDAEFAKVVNGTLFVCGRCTVKVIYIVYVSNANKPSCGYDCICK